MRPIRLRVSGASSVVSRRIKTFSPFLRVVSRIKFDIALDCHYTIAMSTQLSFQNGRNERFGGTGIKGHRKSARPLSRKYVVHVVMKSSQARGSNSLLGPCQARMVRQVLRLQSQKTGVQLLDVVNLGMYLHLTLRIPSRKAYTDFIRASSGLIARKILKKERGGAVDSSRKASLKGQKGFWDSRPLTQILKSDKGWHSFFRQLRKNVNQARMISARVFQNTTRDPLIHSTA